MASPLIAIVGRPNVGKSTLFNRLVGRREAIVADLPGTTRDRIFARITWGGRSLILVDTGGLDPHTEDPLIERVKGQVEMAIQEADVVVFLLDASDGLTPTDEDIAQQLRQLNKPLVVAANKVDNPTRAMAVPEFHALGLGEPIPMSAYHNTGIHELMDALTELLPVEEQEEPAVEGGLRLAIVGRPNVGKSMLVNTIIGQDRAIVSDLPGTTRDALDTPFQYKEQTVTLIDTAGIRRRGRIQVGVERYSVLRAFRAVERADIAILILDATELVAAQDAHIAGLAWEAWKGVIIAVNKWDLAPGLKLKWEEAERQVRGHLHFTHYAPLLSISALEGQGVDDLMEMATSLHRERLKWADSNELHNVLVEALASHPLPHKGRRFLRIYGATQEGINPPTFSFSVNDPNLVHFSYQRYLENRLRKHLKFPRSHIRLAFRTKGRRK